MILSREVYVSTLCVRAIAMHHGVLVSISIRMTGVLSMAVRQNGIGTLLALNKSPKIRSDAQKTNVYAVDLTVNVVYIGFINRMGPHREGQCKKQKQGERPRAHPTSSFHGESRARDGRCRDGNKHMSADGDCAALQSRILVSKAASYQYMRHDPFKLLLTNLRLPPSCLILVRQV